MIYMIVRIIRKIILIPAIGTPVVLLLRRNPFMVPFASQQILAPLRFFAPLRETKKNKPNG